MPFNALPPDEHERLKLLSACKLLDGDGDPAFDALTRVLAAQLSCPIAMINLIDSHRIWAMAKVGIEQRQFSRVDAFCASTIFQKDTLVVPDAQGHKHFKDNDLVEGEPHARFYAGAPLMVEGHALGTVCVLDQNVRHLTPVEQKNLEDIAVAAAALIAARLSTERYRRLEARVRTASLAGSDWLWETDDQGVIQWVSASLIQHTGLNPSTEIGLKVRDIYSPREDETKPNWDRFLAAIARRDHFADAIADRITPRGKITVSISGSPVFSKSGRFMGYRGASSNITRQITQEENSKAADRKLKRALEESKARLSAVLRALPDLWFVIDAEGRYEAAHEFHPMLVRPFDEIKGQPFGFELPTELAKKEAQAMQAAHETGQPQSLVYSLDVKGQRKHFEARVSPMPEGYSLFITRDVTQEIHWSKKLRANEELYRSVTATIGDGLMVVQLDGKVAALNPAGCEILGISPEDIGKINARDDLGYVILSDDLTQPLPMAQWPLTQTMMTGQGIDKLNYPLKRRDGTLTWICLSTHLLRVNQEEEPFAVLATFSTCPPEDIA